MFFGMLGPTDLMIVMAVALVVFGPKRLPEVGRQLGSFMREVRKTMGQFTDTIEGVKSDVGNVVRPDDFWSRSSARFTEQNHLALDQTPPVVEGELMKPYVPPVKPESVASAELPTEHVAPIEVHTVAHTVETVAAPIEQSKITEVKS